MQSGDIFTVLDDPSFLIGSNLALLGDIIYLRIFGNPVMVINSPEVAEDLLERRSKIYSSRFVLSLFVIRDVGLDTIPGP